MMLTVSPLNGFIFTVDGEKHLTLVFTNCSELLIKCGQVCHTYSDSNESQDLGEGGQQTLCLINKPINP